MIEFKNVTKNYGKLTALRDFSIKIDQPGIYCLLGRNGAGKTTMLKTLAGHIAATRGQIEVNGKPVGMLAMPDSVYFVAADAAQFNARLTELLNYAADINPLFDHTFALDLAGRFELDTGKRYRQLSFGMKAMVNTLIALSSGREILLFDEPVLGFDPVMRKTFYDILSESLAEKPKTVIVSTHIIDEIAKVAERLIIIDKGRPLLLCDINEIDERAYCVTGPAGCVKTATEGLRVIGESKAGGFLSRSIYDARIEPRDTYDVSALSLQDFFVALVGSENRSCNQLKEGE
jgi:ABC-2 type transport system ATP-binding protein